ncbi:MAG: elongation factor P [Minisyncoccales bacterium]
MATLSFNEIEKGDKIVVENDPCKVLKTSHMVKGRGSSVLRVKLKNLRRDEEISKTFRPSDSFEEARIKEKDVVFIYEHRGEYVFHKKGDKSKRFSLKEKQIGKNKKYLKPELELELIFFQDEIINISLPIKINYKVDYAPPGVKGNRAEAGTKTVTLETGAKIDTPLFIERGDIIEVNVEKEKYIKRVKKGNTL